MEKFEKKEIKREEKQGRIIGVQRKLEISEIEEKVEAIIFLAKEMVTVQELAQFYAMENFEMEEVLHSLKEKRKDSGINLKIENDVVYFVSNPLFGLDIKNFFNPEVKLKKLSKSAMETLAIIAYKGPVTKLEIEQIRGVSAEKSLAALQEKNLIYISGKKKAIGTPNLYEVSEEFYSYLNIQKKAQLPKEKTIIIYCRGRQCGYANLAAQDLQSLGYSIYSLNRSFADWKWGASSRS